jgi:spermidine synthase
LRATTYFHISGPIGHFFRTFRGTPRLNRVGVVGLGAGTLAVYGEPGQRFTFYEIDPAVARVAADERYFTYLRDCRAEWQTVVGDGRIALGRESDASFGLIVIDAYSSDAIPVHLITREAMQLYFSKLRPDGLLVLNVTNQYFDLPPVLATLAADLGLHGLTWTDLDITPVQRMESKEPSTFVVLAREPSMLLPLRAERRWRDLSTVAPPGNSTRWLWTDSHSSLLTALR